MSNFHVQSSVRFVIHLDANCANLLPEVLADLEEDFQDLYRARKSLVFIPRHGRLAVHQNGSRHALSIDPASSPELTQDYNQIEADYKAWYAGKKAVLVLPPGFVLTELPDLGDWAVPHIGYTPKENKPAVPASDLEQVLA